MGQRSCLIGTAIGSQLNAQRWGVHCWGGATLSQSEGGCVCAQWCPTLCNPVVCSPPGSSVHEILQARILEWVAFPPPGDLPNPGIKPHVSCIGRRIIYHWASWEAPERGSESPRNKAKCQGSFSGDFSSLFSADLLPLRIRKLGTSLVVQLLRLWAPNARGPGSIPAQGTRSHMPQLKILQVTTKTRHSQINKNIIKVRKLCIFTANQNHSQAQVRPKAQALFDVGIQWKEEHHFEFI